MKLGPVGYCDTLLAIINVRQATVVCGYSLVINMSDQAKHEQ